MPSWIAPAIFIVIVVLTGVLLSQNARYALRQYLASRDRLILTLYLTFLVILGALILYVTRRTLDIVQDIRDLQAQEQLEVEK